MNTDTSVTSIVAVTGASGFLGSAIIDELKARELAVLAISREEIMPQEGMQILNVPHYQDLAVPAGIPLIHMAGEARIAVANQSGDAHVEMETALAQSICNSGAGRIVYGSSARVYGDNSEAPHSPDEVLVKSSPYAEAKKAVENLVIQSGGVVARISNVYGEGMNGTLIMDVLAQIPGQGPLYLRDAQSRRDFLWVKDTARGLVDIALGKTTGIFNLGTGVTHSAEDVAQLALKAAGEANRPIHSTQPDTAPTSNTLEISDTTRAFGWRPETTLEAGLRCLLNQDGHKENE
ncbi:MAG: NAD-dependent epimerase/dehydratase family protein [Alphaproteobacteria bacterium]|nr:NAD-dependent epimerase/dehydratase family protein [Alphaproteobacteria bacterium]